MTTNSLKWQQLQEDKRANKASEALKSRATDVEAFKASETARANQAKEGLTARELAEKERANRQSEAYRGSELMLDTAVNTSKELRGWILGGNKNN